MGNLFLYISWRTRFFFLLHWGSCFTICILSSLRNCESIWHLLCEQYFILWSIPTCRHLFTLSLYLLVHLFSFFHLGSELVGYPSIRERWDRSSSVWLLTVVLWLWIYSLALNIPFYRKSFGFWWDRWSPFPWSSITQPMHSFVGIWCVPPSRIRLPQKPHYIDSDGIIPYQSDSCFVCESFFICLFVLDSYFCL